MSTMKHYFPAWYKRLFHKHNYLKFQRFELDTKGQYSTGYLLISICATCRKIHTDIEWERNY